MGRTEAIEALTQYVRVLSHAAGRTTRADDRPRYERHLAQAALMFDAIQSDPDGTRLTSLIDAERHAFGWGFLTGEGGKDVERAFARFADLVTAATRPADEVR